MQASSIVYLLNTVVYIANSRSGVKDLAGRERVGVESQICVELHAQVVLARNVSDWGGVERKQLRPQCRPMSDATIQLLFVRAGAVYAQSGNRSVDRKGTRREPVLPVH